MARADQLALIAMDDQREWRSRRNAVLSRSYYRVLGALRCISAEHSCRMHAAVVLVVWIGTACAGISARRQDAGQGVAPVVPAGAEGAAIVEIGLAPRRSSESSFIVVARPVSDRDSQGAAVPRPASHANGTAANENTLVSHTSGWRAAAWPLRGAQARACERCPGRA